MRSKIAVLSIFFAVMLSADATTSAQTIRTVQFSVQGSAVSLESAFDARVEATSEAHSNMMKTLKRLGKVVDFQYRVVDVDSGVIVDGDVDGDDIYVHRLRLEVTARVEVLPPTPGGEQP